VADPNSSVYDVPRNQCGDDPDRQSAQQHRRREADRPGGEDEHRGTAGQDERQYRRGRRPEPGDGSGRRPAVSARSAR